MGRGRASQKTTPDSLAPDAPTACSPQRTCVGCRGIGDRSELLRIVVNEDGTELVLDSRKAMPGRGAWLHLELTCLDKAVTRRAWGRALKLRSSVRSDALQNVLVERLSTTSPSGDTPQGSHLAIPHDHDRKRV